MRRIAGRRAARRTPVASPDVIVIGGGIAGVAAAAHLAMAGARVLLLEREALAAGASGRNSGIVQHPFDPVLIDLHRESLSLYRDVAAAVAGPFHLPPAPAGLLFVTHEPSVARQLTTQLAASHPELRPAYLGPGEAHALEPAVAADVAACRLEIGYPVGPADATRAYATRALRAGAEVREGVAARPWRADDRIAGVRLEDGSTIAAGQVVVAAGPWSPALIDPAGAWRPIRSQWGAVVTIELAEPPGHVLEQAETDIEPPTGDVEVPTAPHAFSLVTAGGISTLGSTFLEEEPDAAGLVPMLVASGATFVPAIPTARIGPARACARPLSRDGRPLIGRVPGLDGAWIVAGHGPWGISTGPASGRLLADLVLGRAEAPPQALDPARFARTPGPAGSRSV